MKATVYNALTMHQEAQQDTHQFDHISIQSRSPRPRKQAFSRRPASPSLAASPHLVLHFPARLPASPGQMGYRPPILDALETPVSTAVIVLLILVFYLLHRWGSTYVDVGSSWPLILDSREYWRMISATVAHFDLDPAAHRVALGLLLVEDSLVALCPIRHFLCFLDFHDPIGKSLTRRIKLAFRLIILGFQFLDGFIQN